MFENSSGESNPQPSQLRRDALPVELPSSVVGSKVFVYRCADMVNSSRLSLQISLAENQSRKFTESCRNGTVKQQRAWPISGVPHYIVAFVIMKVIEVAFIFDTLKG